MSIGAGLADHNSIIRTVVRRDGTKVPLTLDSEALVTARTGAKSRLEALLPSSRLESALAETREIARRVARRVKEASEPTRTGRRSRFPRQTSSSSPRSTARSTASRRRSTAAASASGRSTASRGRKRRSSSTPPWPLPGQKTHRGAWSSSTISTA
jgi:hypothetical protein